MTFMAFLISFSQILKKLLRLEGFISYLGFLRSMNLNGLNQYVDSSIFTESMLKIYLNIGEYLKYPHYVDLKGTYISLGSKTL